MRRGAISRELCVVALLGDREQPELAWAAARPGPAEMRKQIAKARIVSPPSRLAGIDAGRASADG